MNKRLSKVALLETYQSRTRGNVRYYLNAVIEYPASSPGLPASTAQIQVPSPLIFAIKTSWEETTAVFTFNVILLVISKMFTIIHLNLILKRNLAYRIYFKI